MSRNLKTQKGITFVELLIYMGLFMMIAGFLVGILVIATRIQNRESATAEITLQMDFVLQTIQRHVQESSNIDMPAGTATSTLTLRTVSSSTDPLKIFVNSTNTAVYLQQSSSAPIALTSNRIRVGNFLVTKYENPRGHATVQIEMTLNFNTSTAPKFSDVSRTLRTAIARVSAATFDSDLLPNTNNFFNIGNTVNTWKDAYFLGKVGVGTTTPGAKLDVNGDIASDNGGIRNILGNNGVGGVLGTTSIHPVIFFVGNSERLRIATSGNVGIGTSTPTSKLHIVGGNCVDDAGGGGCTPDYAEFFPSSEPLEKADLVTINILTSDVNKSGMIRKSAKPYDPLLAGIISTSPAIAIEGSEVRVMNGRDFVLDPLKPPVALAGRVPAKVSLENGPIKIGDRLTSSNTPGTAMAACGPKYCRAGMTVGMALESFDGSLGEQGKILVFVNLSWWDPAPFQD